MHFKKKSRNFKKKSEKCIIRASVSAQSHWAFFQACRGCDGVVCFHFGVTDRHNSCLCLIGSIPRDSLCQSSTWLCEAITGVCSWAPTWYSCPLNQSSVFIHREDDSGRHLYSSIMGLTMICHTFLLLWCVCVLPDSFSFEGAGQSMRHCQPWARCAHSPS